MSAPGEVVARQAAGNPLGVFERYLTLWVFLCILAGIGLGSILPEPFQFIGGLELAKVNIPVALLIWLMIIPMLLKIDFSALAGVREHWKGIGVTLFVNWAVKPFLPPISLLLILGSQHFSRFHTLENQVLSVTF